MCLSYLPCDYPRHDAKEYRSTHESHIIHLVADERILDVHDAVQHQACEQEATVVSDRSEAQNTSDRYLSRRPHLRQEIDLRLCEISIQNECSRTQIQTETDEDSKSRDEATDDADDE